MTNLSHQIEFPDYFDDYEAEIATKGYFADLVVSFQNRRFDQVFYDPVRFRQEIEDRIRTGPCYVEKNVVVVPVVNRQHIEAAVDWLVSAGMIGLIPRPEPPDAAV